MTLFLLLTLPCGKPHCPVPPPPANYRPQHQPWQPPVKVTWLRYGGPGPDATFNNHAVAIGSYLFPWLTIISRSNLVFRSLQWRSSLAVCAPMTGSWVPPPTRSEICLRTCLQYHLQTSTLTPLKSYSKDKFWKFPLCPHKKKDSLGEKGGPQFYWGVES